MKKLVIFAFFVLVTGLLIQVFTKQHLSIVGWINCIVTLAAIWLIGSVMAIVIGGRNTNKKDPNEGFYPYDNHEQ